MKIIFKNKELDNYHNYNHTDFSIKFKGKKIFLSNNKNNIKYCYKKLSSWHLKILKKNDEVIYYSEISRMTIWQHNNDQLLRFLILQKFCHDKKVLKLNIKNASKELKIYLKELKNNYENNLLSFIDYKIEIFIYLQKLKLINIFGNLKKIIRLIYNSKFLTINNAILNKKYLSLNNIIIFSYNLPNNSNSYDHYFGELNKFNKNRVSYIYLDVNSKKSNLFNYLTLIDFAKIFNKLLIFLFHKFNKIKLDTGKKINLSSPFSLYYLKSLISSNLILEITVDIFTKKLFQINKNIKFISYPFESKPVEYFLNKNSLLNKIFIKPYLHAFYYSGHISVNNFFYNNKYNSYIIFLSKNFLQEKYFINKNYPSHSFLRVGNLRQHNTKKHKELISNKLKMIFIVSHGYELLFFVEWLTFNFKLLNKYEISIKPYPFAWHNEQINAFKNLNNIIQYKIEENFSKAINKNNIILYGITSAGFELMHTSKLIYHLNLDQKNFIDVYSEYPNMKNFNGAKDKFEFQHFLKNIQSKNYFVKLMRRQKKFYKYIGENNLVNPFDI